MDDKKESKKVLEDNSLTPKVINEVARDLGITPEKVKSAVQHFFLWQRKAFNEMNHKMYLWNYFGTFTMMDKRYEKYINSNKYKRYLDNLTNNKLNNNTDNNEESGS